MITIHNEITIDVGAMDDQPITLWLVSYGNKPGSAVRRYWPRILNVLRHALAEEGYLLEAGDDPYHEDSLAVFAQGFSSPLQRGGPPQSRQ